MRIAVLTTSPAELSTDLVAAIQRTEMEVFDFSWNQSVESWSQAAAFVLLADKDPPPTDENRLTLVSIFKEQNLLGKPILGLGAGAARLLVESGLIPGLCNNKVGLSLIEPLPIEEVACESWLALTPDYQYNAFTQNLPLHLVMPARLKTRAEFVIPAGLLAELKAQGLDIFHYCDAKGQALPKQPIAALANKAGNIMALLAHPEYYPTGDLLFQSLRAHLESGYIETVEPLYYWPRK